MVSDWHHSRLTERVKFVVIPWIRVGSIKLKQLLRYYEVCKAGGHYICGEVLAFFHCSTAAFLKEKWLARSEGALPLAVDAYVESSILIFKRTL